MSNRYGHDPDCGPRRPFVDPGHPLPAVDEIVHRWSHYDYLVAIGRLNKNLSRMRPVSGADSGGLSGQGWDDES
jgi:hypothetical protein